MQIALKNLAANRYQPSFSSQSQTQTLDQSLPTDNFVGSFTSSQKIKLDPSILDSSKMSLDTYQGPLEKYGSFLVLDLEYEQVKAMRQDVKAVIGRELDFSKVIKPEGEAHVTTFTPVEAQRIVAREDGEPGKVTMDEIESLANKTDLRDLDLKILGVGSGSKEIDGKLEETFFLIVESEKLKEVRHQIHELFLSKGGDPEQFDPEHFFPHITIGYTKRDLHEQDGVLKDKENSLDSRFQLEQKNR